MARSPNLLTAVALLAGLFSNSSATALDNTAIERAVKTCVDQVHQFTPPNEWERQYFQQFDAYYNANSGTVQNNAYRGADLPPRYQFNKCMAIQGFPLK